MRTKLFWACSIFALTACAKHRTTSYPPPGAYRPMPISQPAQASPPPSANLAIAAPAKPWCMPQPLMAQFQSFAQMAQMPAPDWNPIAAAIGVSPCSEGSGSDEREPDAVADLVPLLVPGHGPAVVSVPRRVSRPRPIVVALHGAHCRPEWQCGDMRSIVGDRAFVLCPRGIEASKRKPSDGTTYVFAQPVAPEIDAGVAALRFRYGPLVDPGPMVYSGYSLGAALGSGVVMPEPARYPRILLIEGGANGWSERKFADAGGQRALWACGQANCFGSGTAVAARFERAGVPARVAYAPGAGHVSGGAVAEAIKMQWPWFVEGDPRFGP